MGKHVRRCKNGAAFPKGSKVIDMVKVTLNSFLNGGGNALRGDSYIVKPCTGIGLPVKAPFYLHAPPSSHCPTSPILGTLPDALLFVFSFAMFQRGWGVSNRENSTNVDNSPYPINQPSNLALYDIIFPIVEKIHSRAAVPISYVL